jgi:hypothetical protein
VPNQGAPPPQTTEPAPQILNRATPSADEYRAMVNVCLNWAREPLSKNAHRVYAALARAYLRAAVCRDAVVSNYSRRSPLAFEPPNCLPYDRKVLIEHCPATESTIRSVGYSFGPPDVRNEPCEPGRTGDLERAYSARRLALRDLLRVAILALTVGMAGGAGAVLAVLRPSAQQHMTSVAPQTPMAAMENSVSYVAAELADDRRKVDGDTPEPVAVRIPLVAAASAAIGAPPPNESASLGADRTRAIDVTNSLERTTSKEANKAPHRVERRHHRRVAVRHQGWRRGYLFAFLRIW